MYNIKWKCIDGNILQFDISNSIDEARQKIINAVKRLNVDKNNFIIEEA